jgi:hypothetical protein
LRPIGERDPKPFVILSEVKQSGTKTKNLSLPDRVRSPNATSKYL